jgi:hypothetical protein
MPSPIADTRIWRSRTDLARFVEEVRQWHADRTLVDPFRSTLDALHKELTAAAAKLSEYLNGAGATVADAYEKSARFDTALGWLRRVFAFFRDKLDQRDGPNGAALRAADEVIWSSLRACVAARNEPAPVAYIDAQYSPAAFRRDRSLAALVDRGSGFEFLRDYLRTLPIPVLRLPIVTVDAPWTLVLIGHEVGHFVQTVVGANYDKTFQTLVAEVAKNAGATPDEVAAWEECAAEIFADWYSIGVMGPWALWAMAQFELASEEMMRQRRTLSGYPSAVVRLELLRQLADAYSPVGTKLGTSVAQRLDVSLASAADAMTEEQRDRAVASALARKLAMEPLGSAGTLEVAVAYRASTYAEGGDIAVWADALTGKNGKQPLRKIEEARYLAAASARVAAGALLRSDNERMDFTGKLRDKTFAMIKASAVEGTRKPNETTITIADPGERLSSMLLGLDLPAGMPE